MAAKDDFSVNMVIKAEDKITKVMGDVIGVVGKLSDSTGKSLGKVEGFNNALYGVLEHVQLLGIDMGIINNSNFEAVTASFEAFANGIRNFPVNVILKAQKIITTFVIATVTTLAIMNDAYAKMSNQFSAIGEDSDRFFLNLSSSATRAGVSIFALKENVMDLGNSGFRGTSKDLADMAVLTHQFSRVTGIASSETAEFASNLSKFGAKGTEAAGMLLDDFSDIRKTFEMSAGEASSLFKMTEQATLSLFAFSRAVDPNKVKASAMEVAKFGGMMLKVGMSTESTEKILGAMFDPTKWRQNAFLMTQMGYSMGDMTKALTSGEMPKASMMFDNLQKTAKEFYDRSNGNVFVMEKMAASLGITTQELARLGQMSEKEKNATIALQDSQESLQASWKKLGSFVTQFKILMNSLLNLIIKAFTPAIMMLDKVLTPVIATFQNFVQGAGENAFLIEALGTAFGVVATALGIVAIAMGVAAIASSGFMTSILPIILIGGALIGVVTLIVMAFKALFGFIEAKTGIFSFMGEVIMGMVSMIAPVIGSLIGMVVNMFKGLINIVQAGLKIFLAPLMLYIRLIKGVLIPIFGKMFNVLRPAFEKVSEVFRDFGNMLLEISEWVEGVADSFYNIGPSVEAIGVVIGEFFEDIWFGISAVGGKLGVMASGIKGMFGGVIEFITKGLSMLLNPIDTIVNKLATMPMIGKLFKKKEDPAVEVNTGGEEQRQAIMANYNQKANAVMGEATPIGGGVNTKAFEVNDSQSESLDEIYKEMREALDAQSSEAKLSRELQEQQLEEQKEQNKSLKDVLMKLLLKGSGGATSFVGMN